MHIAQYNMKTVYYNFSTIWLVNLKVFLLCNFRIVLQVCSMCTVLLVLSDKMVVQLSCLPNAHSVRNACRIQYTRMYAQRSYELFRISCFYIWGSWLFE